MKPLSEAEALALGRRAVAARRFRWLERFAVRAVMADGTVAADVGTVIEVHDGRPLVYWRDLDDGRGSDTWSRKVRSHHPREHLIPVVTDPATHGWLVALTREALGLPSAQAFATREPGRWGVWPSADAFYWWCEGLSDAKHRPIGAPGEDRDPTWSTSEAGAWVTALELAP